MQSPVPWNSPYKLVAQIGKTKGLDGQLVAQEMDGLAVLREGLEVWVVPPALEGVRHTIITEVKRSAHKHGVLLKLDGIKDSTQASKLVERYLLTKTQGNPSILERAESTTQPAVSPAVTVSRAASAALVSPALAAPVSPAASDAHAAASAPVPPDAPAASAAPVSPAPAAPVASDAPAAASAVSPDAPAAASAPVSPAALSFSDTTYGDLGELVSLKDGPAYDIWVIEGRCGHLEIPAVDAYVVEEGNGQVLLSLPKGFIEITRVDNPL